MYKEYIVNLLSEWRFPLNNVLSNIEPTLYIIQAPSKTCFYPQPQQWIPMIIDLYRYKQIVTLGSHSKLMPSERL